MNNLKAKIETILDKGTECERPKLTLIVFSSVIVISAIVAAIYPIL